jgi:signal transduction histidine kinase
VLTYSRVSRTDLPLETVGLDELLRDIVATYPMFQNPNAEIEIIGELPTVLGIPAVLTQCISNLMGNAVKFVVPGLKPKIKVWSQPLPEEKMHRIFFKDNGLGIEKDSHETIFGIFQRVSKSYEGTGIGLSIVKKGVERMNGRVGLDSEVGKGSTFWLDLKKA